MNPSDPFLVENSTFSSPQISPSNHLFACVKKSKTTGLKTYFYKDDENQEVIIASYMSKTSFLKKSKNLALKTLNKNANPNQIYTPMGEGLHAIVYARYNPNSLIVRKQFKMDYPAPFNPHRLKTLISLHVNKRFRELELDSSICLPFIIENKPNLLFMRKIFGVSLQEISLQSEGRMEVTKGQIMFFLKAISQLADEEELKIVHTDIHAGNILMTNDGKLVLIDFDECVSSIEKVRFRTILNSDYLEFPTEEDYLNGYDDQTPKYIQAPLDIEEEDFYLEEGIYESLKTESIKKFKNTFFKNGQSLFNDKDFFKDK